MKCPKCQTENLADSSFCEECSAPLEAACPTCGTGNRPTAKFCRKCRAALQGFGSGVQGSGSGTPNPEPRSYTPKHLADKILQSKSAIEGERKQVTVLFADVKGSMDLAGQLDPEEWHRVMDRFFAILADGVHRFEGTVNQYTGDGIMALFGAPIAHEDHARRACYAALHIADELRPYANELRLRQGLNFSARMGINSGEVIVGKIGDDLRMDYTAQGHTVGLAARMEQIAEAGKVYLTEHVASLVHGFFQLGDLGELQVKGVQEPLRVYELQGVGQFRTRLDISRTRGFSRFVGRAEEMQVLESALARAQSGQAQIVGIVGEAGLGKSRLCAEFLERCRGSGLMTYEATGVAHGKAIPFLPILQLCRAFFGITEQDSDTTARERIAGRLLLLDDSFRESLPLMFDFLGVPDPEFPALRMDPEARQRQIFAVFRGVIQARGQRETSVTLLEDLHWFDGGSEAFLEPILDAAPGTRGLIMVNFRPEYHAEWTRKSYYQQVALQPLGTDAIRQLLVDLLGTDPSITGLAEAIHVRTAGNPFFTEEVVQGLIESGKLVGSKGSYRLVTPIDKLEVPGTVQALLAARIDRLPEREKRVLQTAAVIGKTFHEPILKSVAALTDAALAEALHTLKNAEFIYEQALYPVAEYVFKHPLTQEVAYGSQLQDRRAQVHAAVARAIEAANPDKLDEHAALLAHHWEAAGEALTAARWHRRAAEWVGTSDSVQALGHWRRVRELLENVPEGAEAADLGVAACVQLLSLGWRVGMPQDEAAHLLAEGKILAARSGEPRLLAELLASYGNVRGLAGDVAGYLQYSIEAAGAADQTDDAAVKMHVAIFESFSLYQAGRLRESVTASEQALSIAPGDAKLRAGFSSIDPGVWHVHQRGLLCIEMGELVEAARHLERAIQSAREEKDDENLAWVHMVHTYLAYRSGDAAGALGHARRALELAEKLGSSVNRVLAYAYLGSAHVLHGEWDAAIEAEEQALRITRETRSGLIWESWVLQYLSEAYLGRADHSRALECAEEAVLVARRCGTVVYEADALLARARALLRAEGRQAQTEIENTLAPAVAIVEQTGGICRTPFILEVRAELAQLTGNETARLRELHEAHRLFVEMGATGHAERTARELGS